MARFHEPVLLQEVIKFLDIKPGEKYIDATVGGGGHAKAILKLQGRVLGLDCDPDALKAAKEYLSTACPGSKFRPPNASWQLARGEVMCRLVRGNFAHLKEIARENSFLPVSGVLFDLGVSSYQLRTAKRGFSFSAEAPLDMRMDPELKVTAADLVNGLNKGELAKLFLKLGDEVYSRRLAEAVCQARKRKRIETCHQLAAIIIKAKPRQGRLPAGKAGRHPATRCFQALRMAVNDELNNLKEGLPQALSLLKPEGRLVVISFHSGEDRIIKMFLKKAGRMGKMIVLTKKPVRPSDEEIKQNPRSRSAKLRAGETRPEAGRPLDEK